jgi:hypothetical protein
VPVESLDLYFIQMDTQNSPPQQIMFIPPPHTYPSVDFKEEDSNISHDIKEPLFPCEITFLAFPCVFIYKCNSA